MSATKCYRCGLPFFSGVMGLAAPQCRCFLTYRPAPDAAESGANPWHPLTESDVRRIVREELDRRASTDKAPAGAAGG